MKPVHAQLAAQSGLNRTAHRALTGPDRTLVSCSRNYRSCGAGYTGSNIAMSVHHEGCPGTMKAGYAMVINADVPRTYRSSVHWGGLVSVVSQSWDGPRSGHSLSRADQPEASLHEASTNPARRWPRHGHRH